ncbi:MAG: carboxypeptidase regulatory-like domain-containing protein, partial [Acidobacteria bacterium]|nr:carboxypeptidase regulatory-like domain-containing protein [Acidobacteriota bacterium]
DKGITRMAVADETGQYRIPLLPPGAYRVRVEAAGFATKVMQGVEVRVGDTVVLNTQMEVGAVSTEVTVNADAAVVEYERSQQAATIDLRRIESLPINRRNYLDFALLTPGVTPTNDIVDGTDFRVVQTPHSGLSFGGGNGRGNSFTVDGVESLLNSGGVRAGVSQEVVQEFQINRSTFTAEFGGASGGAINIITKSGTNDLHGNLFGFLRQRAIQARNYFDTEKSPYTRAQYGATFSAPIVRDKTYLFAGFERLDRHETAFVPILQDRTAFKQLTPSQQQLYDFFDSVVAFKPLAAGMRQALITDNFPKTLKLFNDNSGNFPFSEYDNHVSLRIDHHFSEKDFLFWRGTWSQSWDQNSQFGALIAFNRGRNVGRRDKGMMVSNTYIMNPKWVSESRAMWDDHTLTVTPIDSMGPDITVTGFGSFGREIFLPSNAYERHWQFQQNFNYTSGRHAIKFGVDINPVRDHVYSAIFFGGRFSFGEQIPLASLLPMLTHDPSSTTNVIAALNASGQQRLVPNVMAPLSSLQAYNLGLPTIYQQGFGNPWFDSWFKRNSLFVQDTYRPISNLILNVGLRYELEVVSKLLPTEPHNFAPRIGFAWTPIPNGKTVIRGGYGLYYSVHDCQIANVPWSLDGKVIEQVAITPLGVPGLKNPSTGAPLTSFDVYGYLSAQPWFGKRTITPADIAPLGLKPGPNAPGRVIFGADPNFAHAYAQQASFEIERAVGNLALSAGYAFSRGVHVPRTRDWNLYYKGRTPTDQPIFGFKDPTILQYNMFESTANSVYNALTLQATKRFSNHFTFNAHYTLSKTIDDVVDFNSDWEPHDQLNARAERALSSFDQLHRFVGTAVFESPLAPGRGKGWVNNVFGAFTISPIFNASSGRPFNLLTGFDNLGDNHPTTHRPLNAGRNIGKGPGYFSADMRLARKFPFSADGTRSVEFTAEGFNLLNRTNFKNVNNTVGSLGLADLPRPITGLRGSPTTPLSFTSAFDPRQFQFGLKVNF